MRNMSFAILSAALVLSAPVAARTTTVQGEEQSAAKPAQDKKVCRKLTITGSRVGERVCMTASEWKKVEDLQK